MVSLDRGHGLGKSRADRLQPKNSGRVRADHNINVVSTDTGDAHLCPDLDSEGKGESAEFVHEPGVGPTYGLWTCFPERPTGVPTSALPGM